MMETTPFVKLYKITGIRNWYNPDRKRTTVRRSQKADYAYYEDLTHAKRGLAGLKAAAQYTDLRIEVADVEWEVADV